MNIQGKEYVLVNDRVRMFRDQYQNWGISTEIISISPSDTGNTVIMKATVTDENGIIKSTGMAYEKEGSSYINKTSYIENCETSAVGRALGFMGIGIEKSIASKEEVENAKLQQEAQEVIESRVAKDIIDLADLKGVPTADICKAYKVESIFALTKEQAAKVKMQLAKK